MIPDIALVDGRREAWVIIDHAGFEVERRQRLIEGLPVIVGRDLACSCPEGAACHGDVLLVVLKQALPYIDSDMKGGTTRD